VPLKQECEQILVERVTLNNALDLLVLADSTNATQLKKGCIDSINAQPIKMIANSKWQQFVQKPNCELLLVELYKKLAQPHRRQRGSQHRNSQSYEDDMGEQTPLLRERERVVQRKACVKRWLDYSIFTIAILILLVAGCAAVYGIYVGLQLVSMGLSYVIFIVALILLGLVGFKVYKEYKN